MHTVYMAIGANVGDKQTNIKKAVSLLSEKIQNIVLAPLYETQPWGYEEQENFINTALKGETNLSPEALLDFVKEIEKKVGRVKRFTNGPREIDIDVLLYDDLVYHSSDLIIPHARLHERDFVLEPLADIASEVVHPEMHKTIGQMLQELPQDARVVVKKITE